MLARSVWIGIEGARWTGTYSANYLMHVDGWILAGVDETVFSLLACLKA